MAHVLRPKLLEVFVKWKGSRVWRACGGSALLLAGLSSGVFVFGHQQHATCTSNSTQLAASAHWNIKEEYAWGQSLRHCVSTSTLCARVYGAYRLGSTLLGVGITALDYKLHFCSSDGDDEKAREKNDAVHDRAARRLVKLCRKHGGAYIKLGQYISTLDQIVPSAFPAHCGHLVDKASTLPWKDVGAVLVEDLAMRFPQCDPKHIVEDLFTHIEAEPIAAASFAQVHRARWRETNAPVAIKIQYPHLRAQTRADVLTFHCVNSIIEWFFPEYAFGWLLPEFEQNLSQELDCRQEAYNLTRFVRLFAGWENVAAPAVYWKATTPRCLTMEYIDGFKLTDSRQLQQHHIPPQAVANLLYTVFSRMVFEHGFLHCDLHLGNLLLRVVPPQGGRRQGFQLVVLDHGMYRRLSPNIRVGYAHLWKSLWTQDMALGETACRELKLPTHGYMGACMCGVDALRDVRASMLVGSTLLCGSLYICYVWECGVSQTRFLNTFSLLVTYRALNNKKQVKALQPENASQPISPNTQFDTGNPDVKSGPTRMYNPLGVAFRAGVPELNQFLNALPRDLLWVFRSGHIVRSLYEQLGGDHQERLRIAGTAVVNGLSLNAPRAACSVTLDEMDSIERKVIRAWRAEQAGCLEGIIEEASHKHHVSFPTTDVDDTFRVSSMGPIAKERLLRHAIEAQKDAHMPQKANSHSTVHTSPDESSLNTLGAPDSHVVQDLMSAGIDNGPQELWKNLPGALTLNLPVCSEVVQWKKNKQLGLSLSGCFVWRSWIPVLFWLPNLAYHYCCMYMDLFILRLHLWGARFLMGHYTDYSKQQECYHHNAMAIM